MIKQIIKCLKENQKVTDWLISETETESSQAFYVLQKLETTRQVKTTEYTVTVYHRYAVDGTDYVGSSTFALSHKLKKKDLVAKIEDAVYAASFVKNKAFALVQGDKKKSVKEKGYEADSFALLDQIANIFIGASGPNVKFNALELFYTKTVNHIVNSRNVDLKKTFYKLFVEAIPSFDGEDQKVELYKNFHYATIDFDLIHNNAVEALKDVTARYQAKKIEDLRKADVILKDDDTAAFIHDLISEYSYASVYRHGNVKTVGDMLQKDPKKDLLTISLVPSSKTDAFDRDGVLLKPVKVVENGKLISYYGDNQYAQYLDAVPTGIMTTAKVEKGKSSVTTMTKKPHIEIIALSNIQIESYNDYIGGEVRLAMYFDGKGYHPISGFSFSGSISSILSNLSLSKETVSINRYQGPKYMKLKDMDIL